MSIKFPEGYVAVVKHDCPTCVLVAPILKEIEEEGRALTVYVQDDPSFLSVSNVINDGSLENSFHLEIETVPTLLKIEGGQETARVIGWEKDEWRALTALDQLAPQAPQARPGCGSISVEPGVAERLAIKFGPTKMASRRIEVPQIEDEAEYCFERGWSDGLPVVPPTEERVYRMLQGSIRDPSEVLGEMPPQLNACTVEKVAVNAVMAGCKPEYLPVVLAAVEAALEPAFCLHGLLATTWFSGPMIIVNGPIRSAIDMNWRGNVLGQGNRANASIGRALQLVVRNVGGGRPQETDMSTFGSSVKFGFCFAEDEDTPWTTFAEDTGIARDKSSVTVLSADGVQGCVDQNARSPEPLLRSLAESLRTINHIDMVNGSDVLIVVGPEHGRIFDEAGWSKQQVADALHQRLQVEGQDLGMGADDGPNKIKQRQDGKTSKFRPGGIRLVRAGGQAGLFSAIIPGWLMKGPAGTNPVTKEIRS
ncbi:MAG: thioredoxin family protein [Pseudomonadota bacterium]